MTEQPRGQAEALLLHYWFILRKRKLVVALFMVVLVVVVAIATSLSTRYYAATATIEISPKAPEYFAVNEVSDVAPARSSMELTYYYATQYKILSSRTVMEETIRRLREDHGITDFDDDPKPWETLGTALSLDAVTGTNLIKINIEYPDPTKAELFANTIAEAYMDRNLAQAFNKTQDALQFLETQADKFRARREASEETLHKYRTEHDLMGVDEQYNTTVETMEKLQTAWSDAHTQRIQVEAVYQQMALLTRNKDYKGLASHLSGDRPVLRELLSRYEQLLQEKTTLGTRVLEKHPEMVRVESELKGVEGQIKDEVSQIVAGKAAELSLIKTQEEELQRELEKVKESVKAIDARKVQMGFLSDDAERDEMFFKSLDTRLSEVDLSQVLRANNIQFVDRALASDKPVRPNLLVNLGMALVFGLFGGAAMAFFMEYLDSTVKSREDIEQIVGIPMLGVVPMIPTEDLSSLPREVDRNIFVYARPRSNAAECLRSIRTNVMFRTPQRKFRTLLVTSAAPREGKSFISSNLSTIIAMTGSRVLLIDADMRRPSMHKRFGVENDVGLSNLLTGEVALETVVKHTHVESLDLVTAGPIPPNPGELLGSGRIQRVLSSVRNYDVVVVDSPPVNVVADPRMLSSLVDGVVLVVEANRTSRNLVRQATSHLQEMRANVLGAIVNKLDIRRAGYGYYYYDDYGYYYTEAEKEKAPA